MTDHDIRLIVMFVGVTIERLRGIQLGELDGLGALVVLIGPNGSGKSTVLDAMHMACSATPARAVGVTVHRRDLLRGGRWLAYRSQTEADTTIRVKDDHDRRAELALRWTTLAKAPFIGQVRGTCRYGEESAHFFTKFKPNNDFQPIEPAAESWPAAITADVRLVDPRYGSHRGPLTAALNQDLEQGRFQDVVHLLSEVIPGLRDIKLGLDEDLPVVYCQMQEHSVPAALMGDGIYGLIRLASELAVQDGGLVLLEEPEAHHHPASRLRAARMILSSVSRGTQVILSTHSLEFIDDLVALADESLLPRISLFRLVLEQGCLRTSRFTGVELANLRDQIVSDLR